MGIATADLGQGPQQISDVVVTVFNGPAKNQIRLHAYHAERICARIHQQGGEAVAVRGDVANPDDVAHIFRAADRLGPLTALVNNRCRGGDFLLAEFR